MWRRGLSSYSGGVFAFVESGVADFPETLQVAAQSAHIGPRDLFRGAVEMLGTERSQAGEDRVDFGFAATKAARALALLGALPIGGSNLVASYMLEAAA